MGVNMAPTWDRQGPGRHHVGPMNFAIWAAPLSFPSKLFVWKSNYSNDKVESIIHFFPVHHNKKGYM